MRASGITFEHCILDILKVSGLQVSGAAVCNATGPWCNNKAVGPQLINSDLGRSIVVGKGVLLDANDLVHDQVVIFW